MSARINYQAVNPAAVQAMYGMQKFVRETSLPPSLVDLIVTRVSQINGCAFCLDMHTREAIARGEKPVRLFTLSAWHDTPFFTPEERAALAFIECVALIHKRGVPDDIYEEAARHYSEAQIVELIMVVNTISGWNRLSISTGTQPAATPAD
jgi:AhpD family alkylhydroperoxidase